MTATELISTNVAIGMVYERLSEVAIRIEATRSHHCVVLGDDGQTCVGVVRLADIAGRNNPGNRILGDLVKQFPLVIRSTEQAVGVAALFARHSLGEAIVLDAENRYVGLITPESVLAWSVKELQLNTNASEPSTATLLPSSTLARYVPSSRSGASFSHRLILVVEDHVESRTALLHILRRRNYEVIESKSIADALALAAEHKFDIVISDIELPDGSGFGLMKELRQRYGLKGIAVTGQATETHRALGREAGFSYHLKKPVNIRELEQAIVAVLAAPSGVVS